MSSGETAAPTGLAHFSVREWWRTTKRDLGLLVRVHRLLLEGDWRRAGVLLLFILFQAAVPIAQLWLTRTIVNALVDGDNVKAVLAGLLSVSSVLVAATVLPIQTVLTIQIQDRGVVQVEKEMIRAGSRLRDMVRISAPAYHSEMAAIRQGAIEFSMAIMRANRLYAGVLALIGILISLVTLNPFLPLVLVMTGLLGQLMSRKQADLEYASMWTISRNAAEMNYAKSVATRPDAASEVRMFGIGPWLRERYIRLAREALVELKVQRRKGAIWATAGTTVHAIGLAGSFWYVASRAESGMLSVGDLALFINALIQAQYLTNRIFVSSIILRSLILCARDFFPFVDTARAEITMPPAGEGMTPAAEPREGVSLRNVGFAYPHDGRTILDDLSLDLPAGMVTALVGENGAGKSTLVSLLGRMFDPTGGTITLDGIPFAEYDLTALRDRTTAVFQDGARFAFSLEDNIAIGDPAFSWIDPEAGRSRAREVGRRVGIDTFGLGLKHGYATELTRQFDDSVDLSGGQWQLVAFARGLMRDDAALAMLDEPSSALDPIRESEQIEHIRAFARAERRSVLLISHRLSTVRWADQIAVLDGGRIVEMGSHGELLAANGAYAELFRMQASRYR